MSVPTFRAEAFRNGHVPPPLLVLVGLALIAAIAVTFNEGLLYVIEAWEREEYSYGYIVPPVTAWLVWRRLQQTDLSTARGSWFGVGLIIAAVGLAGLADLGGMPSGVFYAFILALFGLFVAWLGWRATWYAVPALAYLLFALPLPQTLFIKLSTTLQMISSELGVSLMRLFGVSVFLDGNVIDLGVYQLQVAEACSGLGYLFPLSSFAYLVAYLYRGPLWHKALLFASCVPITIAINSVRIGVIGVLVDEIGIEAAEGFYHWFEGYVIFLVGAVLFIAVMWLIARIGGHRGSPWAMIRFDAVWPTQPAAGGSNSPPLSRRAARTLLASLGILVAGAAATQAVPDTTAIHVPERTGLAAFPMRIDQWQGAESGIPDNLLGVLRLDDYVIADYEHPDWPSPVNLYIAFYEAQTDTATIHSPRVCIPAGGWEITDLRHGKVADARETGGALGINRAIIAKGLSRRLVYYWFEQRGRQLTSEYVIKAVNIWDAVTRNRTDGALVRITTPLAPGEDVAAADRRLAAFIRAVYPELPEYVPS